MQTLAQEISKAQNVEGCSVNQQNVACYSGLLISFWETVEREYWLKWTSGLIQKGQFYDLIPFLPKWGIEARTLTAKHGRHLICSQFKNDMSISCKTQSLIAKEMTFLNFWIKSELLNQQKSYCFPERIVSTTCSLCLWQKISFKECWKVMLKTKANEVEDHVIYCFVGNSSDIPVTAPVREQNKVELQTFKLEI